MLQTKQSQTIPKLFRYSAIPLLLVAMSCSGLTSKSRTSFQDASEDSSANSQSQAGGGNFTSSKNDEALPPVSVAGGYLIEVSANCVADAQNSCKNVRFGASVQVGSAPALQFSKKTVVTLGIKSSLWTFPDPLPLGVTCLKTEEGFAFNPLCTGTNSLAGIPIKATLSIKFRDDSSDEGTSNGMNPDNTGTVHGNFMRIAGATGMTAYGEAAATFGRQLWTEMWRDLSDPEGLEFTNILYDGSITSGGGITNLETGGHTAKELCEKLALRRPTILELCGTGNAGACNGGLYVHGLKDLPVATGDLGWVDASLWSSSPGAFDSMVWYVNLGAAVRAENDRGYSGFRVFCVR